MGDSPAHHRLTRRQSAVENADGRQIIGIGRRQYRRQDCDNRDRRDNEESRQSQLRLAKIYDKTAQRRIDSFVFLAFRRANGCRGAFQVLL